MSIGKGMIEHLETAIRTKNFDAQESKVRVGKHGNYLLEWKSEDAVIKAEFLQEDSIGVLTSWLEVEKNAGESVDSSEYLKTAAEGIVERVNYLMEPLKIVEIDSAGNAVQLRSERPERTQGTLSYYEVILKAGKWFGYRNHLSFRRYSHRSEDEPNRKAVAFPLTKQQLERLINDLIAIL